MIINELNQKKGGGKSYVTSLITDEKSGVSKEIFFSVQDEFSEYMVTENADVFVLATILPALVSGQDIIVKAPISDYCYKNSKLLIYLFGKLYDYPPIKVKAESVEHFEFYPTAVATGFSGGVDSFATYYNYTGEECPEHFRITHLTLFNVGAYGYRYENTSKEFLSDAKRAEEFAKSVGKPLILVDSNVSELYYREDIYSFRRVVNCCIAMAVQFLQKLIKTYYVSSGYTIDELKLTKKYQARYESVLSQLFSNNNVEIFVSELDLNRVEKTRLICRDETVRKNLHVCLAHTLNEKRGVICYHKEDYLNCGECPKCVQTLLILDFLGELPNFSSIFNLEKYYSMRDEHIFDILLWKDYEYFKKLIYGLMQESGYQLPESLRKRVEEKKSDEDFIKLQSKYPKI
ncbi:MAG: hypothetical protein R3Y59_03070 [bacterium]